MSSNWISKPISPMNTNLWSQENQSSMKFQEKSPVEKEQTNKFKQFCSKISPSIYKPCFLGLIVGVLLAGIALAAISTVWLHTTLTSMSSTMTSTTTFTTTSQTTTSTTETTTTTTQLPAVARSSLPTYCGCSSFILSLSNISFITTNTTYQWQSSPIGQNIWSNINIASTTSSLTIASQINSTDYQCQIIVLSPTPINLTSSVVTVTTTTNISYCQPRATNCQVGDEINNFIFIGELGTQINDINTTCAANSYDNRTQESVSLYENMNYTAQVSARYPSGEQLVIWIDFNKNFNFESWEKVGSQLLNQSYNTDVKIVIPSTSSGATIGSNIMRAVVAYSGTPGQCGSLSTYGETHDYTVNILASSG